MCLTVSDGKKVAMPRYYKLKLYDEYELDKIASHMRTKILLQEAAGIERHGLDKWVKMKELAFLEDVRKYNENYKKDKL